MPGSDLQRVFVDDDRKAADAIRTNLSTTGLSDQGRVIVHDVVTWARSAPELDVVFADPPYAFDEWSALGSLRAQLFVAESDREVELGGRWGILRSKRYGGTVVSLFEPRSEPL